MTRVANYSQSLRNQSYLLATQRRLTDGQIQVSSGKKAEHYSGVASDSRRLVNVESSHVRTTQYINNNNLVEQRLQSMETNVSQAFDVITEYKTLIINALNADNSADLAMQIQAQSKLDEMTSLLNLQDDGRYLFSGNRTDSAPVDQTGLPATYTVPSSDGDSLGYYQGDSTVFSVQADDNFTVNYGVTANEPGFERAIRSMHMIVIGPPNDRATLEEALGVIDEAINNVSDIRTRIGAARAALENVNTRLTDFQLFSEKTIGDLENTDVTEVISSMAADQLALEASYSIISRLADLTLVRFLR